MTIQLCIKSLICFIKFVNDDVSTGLFAFIYIDFSMDWLCRKGNREIHFENQRLSIDN